MTRFITYVNPGVVIAPDGRVGCLIALEFPYGCVAFGNDLFVEAFRLDHLSYHIQPGPLQGSRTVMNRC